MRIDTIHVGDMLCTLPNKKRLYCYSYFEKVTVCKVSIHNTDKGMWINCFLKAMPEWIALGNA